MALSLDEPDRTRLPRSPLELVVCQIRFERQVAIGDPKTATTFHQALGGTSGPFPEIGEVVSEEVNLPLTPGTPGAFRESRTSGWRFSSGRTLAAVLMPDHVALETNAYTTWEDFSELLAQVIDAVAEVVEPAIEQRIGLRYVDRIQELDLKSPAEWESYIRSEFLGPILHRELGPGVRAAHQQLLIELEDGISCGLRHGPVDNQNRETVDYVLDYDLFRQSGRPFDPEGIKETAALFNRLGLQLFQATITDDLLDYLRER
jgi:uncharacterized protein (TIGR04255 family)